MKVKLEDPRALTALDDALRVRARGGELVKVTRADAVALTGMPSEQAEPALKSLVRTYRSHLAVTDEGELVYEFDPRFERRDRVPLAERLRSAGEAAWRGFSLLFKVWIAVTLVAYVIAFIAMMIGISVMGRGSDRDDRRGGGFGLPWIWYWMLPDLARDPYGRPIQRRGPPKKRFYLSVFDFVLGPKRPPSDPKEMEKRLVAFLRAHKGRVTAAELAALTGLSLADSDEELTRLMVEYDGEVEVAEDGTLLYVFEDLMLSAGQSATPWTWDFERPAPREALTGNTPGTNAVVAGFSGFNLLASLTVGPAFLQRAAMAGVSWASSPVALFFVLWFPLMFSLIFFAVPAARWAVARRRRRQQERRQLRRRLFRDIWKGEPLDPAQYPGEAKLLLDRLLVELDGDVDTDAEGRVRYRFPRLAQERAAVAQAREKAAPPELGRVIFSSDDVKVGA